MGRSIRFRVVTRWRSRRWERTGEEVWVDYPGFREEGGRVSSLEVDDVLLDGNIFSQIFVERVNSFTDYTDSSLCKSYMYFNLLF